jgi:phage terminase small subunit
MALSPRQQRFVEEYLVDLNSTQAAIRAGYAPKDADVTGPRLLGVIGIREAIATARQAMSERTEITADSVLKRWYQIAMGDPRGLVEYRRAPCRHCNGVDHGYQWKTPREFNQAVLDTKQGAPPPTDVGGYGYRVTDEINPECPECAGEGVGYTLAADTRNLRADQVPLYAGTRQTKDGLEIKIADQGKALEMVAKHLGMFVERKQMLGADGKPIDPGGTVLMIDYGDGRGPRTAAEVGGKKAEEGAGG